MRRSLPLIVALSWACTEESATAVPDAALADAAVDLDAARDAELERDAAPRLGMFGEPCDENVDCLSGYCVEAAEFGRICTQACGECPEGFECEGVANAGPDRVFLCLADQPDLCQPCETDRECDDNADLCLDFGNNRYCGEDCADDGRCPDGYECVAIGEDGDAGVAPRQCVPAGGEGCRPCRDVDGDGYGEGEDCLGFDCNDADDTVYEGAPEVCDDRDNDCNSVVDDGVSPADSDVECLGGGVCRGTQVVCEDGAWLCAYPDTYEGAAEATCDGLDNDCDGATDEGLIDTPEHCGACNQACALENAVALCAAGVCGLESCAPGWVDLDGVVGNGCEFACAPAEDPNEVCNGRDDDCDGRTDEGFDLQRDVAHCGACGDACAAPNGTPACVDGACTIDACDPGFFDVDGDPSNGCEYACERAGEEVCNGADDDCDGAADEAFDLAADPVNCGACGRACLIPNAEPRCAAGECALAECIGGFANIDGDPANGCEYACFVQNDGAELCNGVDDDCDGRVDEDFDLQNDLANCGACGAGCALLNADTACAEGQCDFVACREGFFDVDGEPGCEYRCDPVGDEVCDGVDDDCDGRIDEGVLNRCGFCGAEPAEVCDGADNDCDGVSDEGVQNRCGGCGPEPAEVCDGLDNDCDGVIDDGAVCGPYVQGRCRIFFGWADERRGPPSPSVAWEGCPAVDRDFAGDVRCAGTRRDGRFARTPLGGDVDDNDQFALMFQCDDGGNPALANYVQTHCAVFLGHADRRQGPDDVDRWGGCPVGLTGDDGRLRCTSSGYDGRFRALTTVGDVNEDDDFGVAWICRDAQDPARAAALQGAVEVFLGWGDRDAGQDGAATWAGCPGVSPSFQRGIGCVSTQGDGRFHRLTIENLNAGDVNGDDRVAWALRAR